MAKKKQAIVSVTNDLYTDNRVNKVCLFLVKQGYEVTLVGRLLPSSQDLAPRKYATKRMKLRNLKGAKFYAEYNLRLFFYLLFHKADLLVSNDLDTLLANYVVSKFKPLTRLVYDSHEYYTEVPELVNRPKVKQVWESIEQWIFPKLKTIYTVNQSIASLYAKKYNKDIKIVRNISPQYHPENLKTKKELGIPENTFLIILQGAGINVSRGAEEAVEAMNYLGNATLLIVGDGDVVDELKKYVNDYDLQQKVLFFGKRPYPEMMNFTALSDLGLTLDKPNNLNYQFSLPNKVFDYIHAGTPFICTDLVEIRRIVDEYHVGSVLETLTPELLADRIRYFQQNTDALNELKENCKKAAPVLNWENEQHVLEEIYPAVS